MKKYNDRYFDLAICDIPYGIDVGNMAYLRETGTRVKQKNGNRLNANKNKRPYTAKDWDKNTPGQDYFDELRRVSKHQIIFGIDYVSWSGIGSGRIIWDKGVADGSSFKRYEVAYCSSIDHIITIPLLWAGMFQAKSLSEPMVQQGNKKLNEKRIHPCHKPVMLYQRLIMDFGFKGCKILDTHIGGGSIRIAAHQLNCDIIGFEIDDEYYDAQETRFLDFLKMEQNKLPLEFHN